MQSYKRLYEVFTDRETLRTALYNASTGKKKKRAVRKALSDVERTLNRIEVYARNFKPFDHTPKEIYDGVSRKKRTIIVPHFDEQIIHHALILTLKPIMKKGMYYHSYGSIPDKGLARGAEQIKKWIRNDNYNTRYYLKLDIKKYFESVDVEIIIDQLRQEIKDERIIDVMARVLRQNKGLPLGFYTSQWLANYHLNGLDRYIKETLGAKYYLRYMDDMLIFSNNKEQLHGIRAGVARYLKDYLGLKLKGNYRVSPLTEEIDLDMLGFRFYRGKTILRKNLFLKMRRKAKRVARLTTIYSARQMMSYKGWLKRGGTRKSRELINSIAPFDELAKVISKHERSKA